MGCCYSHEDHDFVPPEPSARRPTPTARRPTPTATSSRSIYDNQYRAVPPLDFRSVPVHYNVSQQNVLAVVFKPTQEFAPKPGALYGEYKCSCKNFWVSRLSWRDKDQQCIRCKRYVRPRNQRELRPSDFKRANGLGSEHRHPEELCEMCQQIGGYCGKNM